MGKVPEYTRYTNGLKTDTHKCLKNHQSSGKCKWMPQWGITSQVLGCPLFRRQQINTGEDAE